MNGLMIGLRQMNRKRRGKSCNRGAFSIATDDAMAVFRLPDAIILSDAAHDDKPSIDWITQKASTPVRYSSPDRDNAPCYHQTAV